MWGARLPRTSTPAAPTATRAAAAHRRKRRRRRPRGAGVDLVAPRARAGAARVWRARRGGAAANFWGANERSK